MVAEDRTKQRIVAYNFQRRYREELKEKASSCLAIYSAKPHDELS
jgi:hypothetical protein